LRAGIETLFRANSIDLVRGSAELQDANTVKVAGDAMNAKSIIIAAGSRVSELAGIAIDEKDVVSSDGILDIRQLPKSIVIIGGGVIGCEFANLFNAFGAKVTIVEFLDRLVSGQSREVSKKLESLFKARGMDIFTSSKAESITKKGLMEVAISGNRTIEAERVLVSVGRVPNTDGLGLEKVGIKTQDRRICVDEHLRTNIGNIYAIGDCVAGPLLAHKASYDGVLACDNIMGKARRVDYSNVPSCIWTEPEIASVGLSEEDAKRKCQDVKIARFPYLASGKAYLEGRTEGFIKIIGDAKGDILGVEIFGAGACDLIGEATLARTLGINIKEWVNVVHGHPTLSEVIQEAARIFCGAGIHSI
jgi:dihydrolipoamide dehydrogenase